MELSKEQINIVKNYVETNLNYADLKLEVLDHMIMDTENFMQEKGIVFEDAFRETTLKWNILFQTSQSLVYFGSMYSAPRLVINKAKKAYKNYFFGYLVVYFLPLMLKIFKHSFDEKFILSFDKFIHISLYVALVVFNYIWFKTIFSKLKSTYSFIIKTFFFMNIFYLIPLLSNSLFSANGVLQIASTSFAFAGLYIAIISIIFYKRHLKSIRTPLITA